MKNQDELNRRNQLAELGGGQERLAKQHKAGKLSARERINSLLDPDSFVEIDKFKISKTEDNGHQLEKFYGDGVVTGSGKINGRQVFVFAQDFTVYGGSLSAAHAQKIVKVMDLALENGCPIIGLNDSGGARIQEGVESLAGYADIFLRNVLTSGVIPQISLVLGPCAGGAVYSPAITDFIFMVDKVSHMFITGPDVIKQVTKEDVDKETLGGAATHNQKSGVAHFVAASEQDCLEQTRRLISFLPQNNLETTERVISGDLPGRTDPELLNLIPEQPNKPYDIRKLIISIADNHDFMEVQSDFAKNIITGFLRLDGYSVGVVANQPDFLAGCLDINASTKAARFVRCCDAFNIPLLTLVDVPGFLPGVQQEHGGIIRHGAKLLYAFAEATVPKVTLITRKAYGGAYDVMASKHIRADFNYAYPSAEVAVMGPEGAVNIIHRKKIEAAKTPEEANSIRQKLIDDYRQRFSNPWQVAELGFIDRVINPAETRMELIQAFSLLKNKSQKLPAKKHGNIPL